MVERLVVGINGFFGFLENSERGVGFVEVR